MICNKPFGSWPVGRKAAIRRVYEEDLASWEPLMKSSDHTAQLVALSALPAGEEGVVHSLQGGHEFGSRVANLGFTPGAPLRVLQNRGHGPVLVSVRGTLVALGRAEATRVTVQNRTPANPEEQDADEGRWDR
jgi:Fe2+ transport system protein FeoA